MEKQGVKMSFIGIGIGTPRFVSTNELLEHLSGYGVTIVGKMFGHLRGVSNVSVNNV